MWPFCISVYLFIWKVAQAADILYIYIISFVVILYHYIWTHLTFKENNKRSQIFSFQEKNFLHSALALLVFSRTHNNVSYLIFLIEFSLNWWDRFFKISCECEDWLFQSFQTPTKSVKVEQTKILNRFFSSTTILWKCML